MGAVQEDKGRKRRAIIYNENIREEGRKNFCISHEIGHNSCHADQEEFFLHEQGSQRYGATPPEYGAGSEPLCGDIVDASGRLSRAHETSARHPDDDFSSGRRALQHVADGYVYPMLDLSPTAYYGMAVIRDGTVARWANSKEMRWTGFGFRKGHQIPAAGLAVNSVKVVHTG